ncbi:MAG: hypothetical protein ABFS05_10575, partial [Bacteroidota bacterium]
MKVLISGVIFLFVISVSVKTQNFWEWTEPAALTDSISDNINADLYFNWDFGDDNVFMVWEKSFDSISTAIYFDNILDTNAPIAVISDSAIQYTNPRIINASNALYPDYQFHVLYETNQNGNIDIYCVTYLTDGSFTQAEAIVNTLSDELNFNVGVESLWWPGDEICKNVVAYIKNDSLFAIHQMQDGTEIYWSNEIFIDNPVNEMPLLSGICYGSKLRYLKADPIENHIFSSWCDHNGNWNIPEVFYDSTNCRNMNNILHRDGIIWSTYEDSVWKITHDNYYPGYYTYDISKSTPFDPV